MCVEPQAMECVGCPVPETGCVDAWGGGGCDGCGGGDDWDPCLTCDPDI